MISFVLSLQTDFFQTTSSAAKAVYSVTLSRRLFALFALIMLFHYYTVPSMGPHERGDRLMGLTLI